MAKKQPVNKKLSPHHKDKDIDELLRIYGEDNVKIIYDSDR
jgi:hypothetical protein